MPRKARQTPQQVGSPVDAYPQRTDLAAGGGTQPIRVATGQEYGAAKTSADLQRAIPLPQVEPVPGDMASRLAAAKNYQMPQLGMNAPSSRPNEPLTAGVSVGPGPGPVAGRFSGASMLRQLAADTNDNELRMLADLADAQGV